MAPKKISKTRQQINAIYEENELAGLKQNQFRGRSLTVGSATGGIIELCIRGDFSNLWFQMQPTEAVELIGQIAAAAGVEIAMRPRNDFAAWRSWDATLPASVQWMGAAPWQLSEEDRTLLAEAKAKNIKAIEGSDDDSKPE
jgi:hypothetical protein